LVPHAPFLAGFLPQDGQKCDGSKRDKPIKSAVKFNDEKEDLLGGGYQRRKTTKLASTTVL